MFLFLVQELCRRIENNFRPVSSFNSETGFLFKMQAIQTGWVHPNINLENPDKGVVSFSWFLLTIICTQATPLE